jgi:hypothetical protein
MQEMFPQRSTAQPLPLSTGFEMSRFAQMHCCGLTNHTQFLGKNNARCLKQKSFGLSRDVGKARLQNISKLKMNFLKFALHNI